MSRDGIRNARPVAALVWRMSSSMNPACSDSTEPLSHSNVDPRKPKKKKKYKNATQTVLSENVEKASQQTRLSMATNLFGLSDLAAPLSLINTAAKALRECGGRYHATVEELHFLETVLRQSQALQPLDDKRDLARIFQPCAHACLLPVGSLVSELRKHEKRFDRQHSIPSYSSGNGAKVQWALAIEEEVKTFKSYTGPYLSTINVFLRLESLQRPSTMPDETNEDAVLLATTIRHQIDALRALVLEQATSYSQLIDVIPLLDDMIGGDSSLRQVRMLSETEKEAEEMRIEIDRLHYREEFQRGFAEASRSPHAPVSFKIPPAPIDNRATGLFGCEEYTG